MIAPISDDIQIFPVDIQMHSSHILIFVCPPLNRHSRLAFPRTSDGKKKQKPQSAQRGQSKPAKNAGRPIEAKRRGLAGQGKLSRRDQIVEAGAAESPGRHRGPAPAGPGLRPQGNAITPKRDAEGGRGGTPPGLPISARGGSPGSCGPPFFPRVDRIAKRRFPLQHISGAWPPAGQRGGNDHYRHSFGNG
ncbi:hypothetical protein DESC_590039 [Desulfosarcina cetonica]|nr:hypothetical protein DESC_590039 [Desulfosarcina cetonica]